MADNLNVTPGSGAVVAAKEDGGVLHQRALLEVLSAAGSPVDVGADNPVPIDKQDEIIYLLAAILEKLPRVDTADRVITNGSEITQSISISSNQTLTTLTTLGNMSMIGSRDVSHAAFALANAGAMHIYNNIQVTA